MIFDFSIHKITTYECQHPKIGIREEICNPRMHTEFLLNRKRYLVDV